jgi:hypothetical protein
LQVMLDLVGHGRTTGGPLGRGRGRLERRAPRSPRCVVQGSRARALTACDPGSNLAFMGNPPSPPAEAAAEAALKDAAESQYRRIWLTWLFAITLTVIIFASATMETISDSHLPNKGQLKMHELAVIALTAAALFAVPEVVKSFGSLARATASTATRVVLAVYTIIGGIFATLGAYGAQRSGAYSLTLVVVLAIVLLLLGVGLTLLAWWFAKALADYPRLRTWLSEEIRHQAFLLLAVLLIILGGTLEWLIPFV